MSSSARSPSNNFALAGIIGWPVAQSRSPVIQNYWLNEHTIPGRYVLLPVTAENLPRALHGLPVLGFRGCNVTMPTTDGAADEAILMVLVAHGSIPALIILNMRLDRRSD